MLVFRGVIFNHQAPPPWQGIQTQTAECMVVAEILANQLVFWTHGLVRAWHQTYQTYQTKWVLVPQNRWFIIENPIKMDDLGGKPTIFGNTQIPNSFGLFVAPKMFQLPWDQNCNHQVAGLGWQSLKPWLLCNIGGAIWSKGWIFPIKWGIEELKHPRILKITGSMKFSAIFLRCHRNVSQASQIVVGLSFFLFLLTWTKSAQVWKCLVS